MHGKLIVHDALKSIVCASRLQLVKWKAIEGKVNFSLGARAHDSKGNLVWI